MKRFLLIGFAASTFALASILPALAMPSANLSALTTSTDSSIIQVHGWATTADTDGATIGDIIAIGEIKF